MEIETADIFQINSDSVRDAFNDLDNYKIIYNESTDADRNLCALYFSSNEIYYPNTEKSFNDSIRKRDKYEWQNNLLPGVYKHILIRDIRKQWYITGINSECDTPELLAAKLHKLTSGYTVCAIGSSAGGFAALLYGSLLGVKKVYAFNAQMDLNVVMKDSNEFIDPVLFQHRFDSIRSEYYTISGFLNPKTEYFYFQSAKSKMDIDQFDACTKKQLFTKIQFLTSNHGFPFLRQDLKHVFEMSDQTLRELGNKKIHPFIFSVKIHGLGKASVLTIQAVLKRIKKKLKERHQS